MNWDNIQIIYLYIFKNQLQIKPIASKKPKNLWSKLVFSLKIDVKSKIKNEKSKKGSRSRSHLVKENSLWSPPQ
jgi:hypothetical protein